MEAEIDITTMSSKGQIVIPSSMRKDFEEGEKFIIIKKDKKFILKELKSLSKTLEEDLIFAKRTEEALERHSKGQFKSSTKEDFLKYRSEHYVGKATLVVVAGAIDEKKLLPKIEEYFSVILI